MNTRSPVIFFSFIVISFSCGWLAKGWFASQYDSSSIDPIVTLPQENRIDPQATVNDRPNHLSDKTTDNELLATKVQPQKEKEAVAEFKSDGTTVLALFSKLLNSHRYDEAMNIYRDQYDEQVVFNLRRDVLGHLDSLLNAQDQNNFSELVNLFLADYYDDIDVLLLLAKFNIANGLYMEAVNIYQLSKSYAYSSAQQQDVLQSFGQFVGSIDRFYAEREDWFSLINLYAHIDATGLLSSDYQYRQAIVYHKSGDDYSAIEQLKRLQNDSLVGSKARNALKSLSGSGVQPSNPWQGAERVALQRQGNQYLVNLGLNRRDNVTLLIDTGASMTTLSRSSFLSLNSNQQAVEIGQRLFQTANGVVKGRVYSMPQLNLGSFSLRNVQVAVLDFTMSSGVDGLLGMNVLGQFRFQIDQDDANLYLNKK